MLSDVRCACILYELEPVEECLRKDEALGAEEDPDDPVVLDLEIELERVSPLVEGEGDSDEDEDEDEEKTKETFKARKPQPIKLKLRGRYSYRGLKTIVRGVLKGYKKIKKP